MKNSFTKTSFICLTILYLVNFLFPYTFPFLDFNEDNSQSILEVVLSIFIIIGYIIIFNHQHKHIKTSQENKNLFHKIFETANDAIYLFELMEDGMPGKFVEVNKIACERFGYTRSELLNMSPLDITSPNRKEKVIETQNDLLKFGKLTFEGEYVGKSGNKIPSEIHVCIFEFKNKKHALSISRDISERKKAEELIYNMAYYDILTGLANRRLFEEQLENTLKEQPNVTKTHTVMFLDLDYFKKINDSYGHDIGDALLKNVALRLRSIVRENDLVSRRAGDEFTILLPNITKENALKIAERIIISFQTPILIGEHLLHVSCSIGITFNSNKQTKNDIVLRHADLAMYEAKNKGKNSYQVYEYIK